MIWLLGSGSLTRFPGHLFMLGSMGQVGSAGDNAAMESLFSLLQNNVLNRHSWDPGENAVAHPFGLPARFRGARLVPTGLCAAVLLATLGIFCTLRARDLSDGTATSTDAWDSQASG
jgi:hypothetical protein